jgi:hypothetical protein
MDEALTQDLKKQGYDTVKVVVALLKGFIIAAIAYFVSLGLTLIIRRFGGTQATEALEFFDACFAALTYFAVAAKDLLEITFK